MAASGAGFAATGAWIVENADDWSLFGFGWLLILICTGFSIIGGRQLFRVLPVIEIDANGILWRRWSGQVIPWSAIVRAEVRKVRNHRFLCLWLDAPLRYPARSTLGKLSRVNKSMGFGDIALNTVGTDQRFGRLVAAVDAHFFAVTGHRVGTGSGPE